PTSWARIFRRSPTIAVAWVWRMIGDRQRHRDLTIVLLAKLAAILSSHPDRMLPFLGKARVVDDPRFDRPVAFQLWQHQFPPLRETLLVGPSSLADKMQQRLMLGCGPFWRRDRCHRLHAFALARHHQTQAIIAKRLGPVRMPDHPREPLHIG